MNEILSEDAPTRVESPTNWQRAIDPRVARTLVLWVGRVLSAFIAAGLCALCFVLDAEHHSNAARV